MEFNIKSAGQYSNVLSVMISRFQFGGNDVAEGLVKKTETSLLSRIVTGTDTLKFEDEVEEIKPERKISQIDPMVRIKILEDLVTEKNKIDYEINKKKSTLNIKSPITGETINVDLAKKENALYKNALMDNGYKELLDVNDSERKVIKNKELKIEDQKIVAEYPVIIKTESKVDSGVINEKYAELYNKTQEESNLIDSALSGAFFHFDCKFPTYYSEEKIIAMYIK